MRRKLTAIIAGAMMVGSVSAEDIKMSPVFDVSYLHSEAKASGLNQGQYINSRDDLDVQYAGIDFSGSSKSLSWTLAVNFAGDAANSGTFINQAFMSYAINDNISFMAGRFYSFVGYEAARNNGEWNYTKSIAKTVSPYWHEGVGASYDAKNGFMASVYYVDGIEDSEDSIDGSATPADYDSAKKGLGATVSYAMDKWKAEFDYYTAGTRGYNDGSNPVMAFNFKYDFSDKFSAAFAALMGTSEQSAANKFDYTSYAAYVKFQATEKLYFAGRYEMFNEDITGTPITYSGATVSKNHDINSITLTAGHNFMNGSEVKLEYRMDSADDKIYTVDGKADDGNNTMAVAWLYNY